MTEQDFIVALATRVMGWTIKRLKGDGVALRRDGRTVGYVWDGADYIDKIEGWNPLTSDADALGLVDAAVAAGWEVVIGCFKDGTNVEIRRWRDRRAEGVPGDPFTGRSRETFVCHCGKARHRTIAEAIARAHNIELPEGA